VMIDLQNESIINWNDWYDNSEQILEAVYEEKYHISYGGFKVKSHEEIYEEVKKRFKNNDDSLFFFMRNGKPCFLIGNLPNHEGGYSIIELEK